MKDNRPTIQEVEPLEQGGTVSRAGLKFQDHVAVGQCLKMLTNQTLTEVWIETHDDITLVWDNDGFKNIDYVQVKSTEGGSFWSIGEICRRDKLEDSAGKSGKTNAKKIGTSIVEKSLANDRTPEHCSFRMITSRDVHPELRFLKAPFNAPARKPSKCNEVIEKFQSKLSDYQSPNKHDCKYWIENMIWEVEHSIEHIETKNLQILREYADSKGLSILLPELKQKVYKPLLLMVQDAGEVKWQEDPDKKKVFRSEFISLVDDNINSIERVASVAGQKLRKKMERAYLGEDYISSALNQRIEFRKERLNPKYIDQRDLERIEANISAELQILLTKLDAGEIQEGFEFYKSCLEAMKDLHGKLSQKGQTNIATFTGCMYEITDRCDHRFTKSVE